MESDVGASLTLSITTGLRPKAGKSYRCLRSTGVKPVWIRNPSYYKERKGANSDLDKILPTRIKRLEK
jgi:hypothetical protein